VVSIHAIFYELLLTLLNSLTYLKATKRYNLLIEYEYDEY